MSAVGSILRGMAPGAAFRLQNQTWPFMSSKLILRTDNGAFKRRSANTNGALRGQDAIGIFVKVTSDEPEGTSNGIEADRGRVATATGHKFIDGDLSIPAEHELGTIAEFELSKAGLHWRAASHRDRSDRR